MRALLDEWFSHLGHEARRSIRPRFRSPRHETHLGAFFELYQHELAIRGDWDHVDFDVGREDHQHPRPDLLLKRDAKSCYVEATVALGDDVVEPIERARVNQLRDAIERIRIRDFLLDVDVRGVGSDTPGRKTVGAQIDGWLAQLDPDTEITRAEAGEEDATQVFEWGGWKLIIKALGKRPDVRDRDDLGVIGLWREGFGGYKTVFEGEHTIEVDGPRALHDERGLANALLSKANHPYELAGHPFVIAVLCAGAFVSEHEIAQALIGPIEHRLGGGSGYQPGGLWLEGAGWRHSHVSAVMTFTSLSADALAIVEPCLWTHPQATHPISPDLFPWRRIEIQPDGSPVEIPASRNVAGALGVSPRFPAD